MDFQIHCIEREAYGTVLKAFISQSENLTWDKEGLITELRKELGVSDAEHREILQDINSDETIKSIREWRRGKDTPLLTPIETPPAHTPSFWGHTSYPRLNSTQKSEIFLPKCPSFAQLAQTPVVSSAKYPLVSQPVTVAISPSLSRQAEDEQCNKNEAVFSHQMHVEQPALRALRKSRTSTSSKARGSAATKKRCKRFGFRNLKPGSSDIENQAPDRLISEAGEILGGINSNTVQTERMKAYGRSIVDVVGVDESDGDASPDNMQRQISVY